MEKVKKMKRCQSLGEEIGNAVTHGVGALLAIAGFVLMLVKQDSGIELASVLVFGISMIVIYISSCLYHSFKSGSKVKKLFRIFDHSSIYILIAGTYTPILLCVLGGWLGWLYFGIQWGVVVIGILLRLFVKSKNTVLQCILYVLLGWSGLSILPQLYSFSPELLWFILGGGIAYSAGIAFYASRFKYAHFVWHFFVIMGTVLHFFGIYFYML